MISIKRQGNGLRVFDERLTKLSKMNIDAALRTAGAEIVDFTGIEVFATEGAAGGRKWKPLSAQYERIKARLYPGRGILEATGKMSRSFRYQTRRSLGMNVLRVYNIDPKFPYHQLGTPRMPARPMLRANQRVREIVEKNIQALFK